MNMRKSICYLDLQLKNTKKNINFLHTGLIQEAVKPLISKGLNASSIEDNKMN